MRMAFQAFALIVLAVPALGADRVALLPIEFVNTSLEQTRPDETTRIVMLQEAVSQRMADAGLELVDAAPVAA